METQPKTLNDYMLPALICFILLVCNLLFYKMVQKEESPEAEPEVQISPEPEVAPIQKIGVLVGSSFDLLLRDGRRIKGQLERPFPSEAKEEIVNLANISRYPRVVMYEKKDDVWLVDLVFEVNGEDVKLSKWLEAQGLVFQ